jgi:hypothetical protein
MLLPFSSLEALVLSSKVLSLPSNTSDNMEVLPLLVLKHSFLPVWLMLLCRASSSEPSMKLRVCLIWQVVVDVVAAHLAKAPRRVVNLARAVRRLLAKALPARQVRRVARQVVANVVARPLFLPVT